MAEPKYNVYAWNKKHSRRAVRVETEVDIITASMAVDAYMARGLDWDAYLVRVDDDPGWPLSDPDEETD